MIKLVIMLYTEKNDAGKIEFDKGIIAQIIAYEIESWRGKVFLSNIRGKLLKNKVDDSLEVFYDGESLRIKLYLVLRFGLSIKKITQELITSIHDGVSDITGLKVSKVTLILTGVLSKNISKRYIEVSSL